MAGNDANTKLLLHFDGADGTTATTDSSGSAHVMSPVDNAQIDTAQSKFGGSCALFDGAGDYYSAPDSSDWDLHTTTSTEYTIDFWVRFSSLASNQGLCGQYGASNSYWDVIWSTGNQIVVELRSPVNIGQYKVAFTPIVDTWYHIAVSRSATTRYIFIDGVEGTLISDIQRAVPSVSGILTVGAELHNNYHLDGWIEEFRVSDVVRWEAGFTPETEAYSAPPIVNTDIEVFQPQAVTSRQRFAKKKTNPGWSVTPGMHIPVPIKLDKWSHIYNTPVRTKKRNIANVTKTAFVDFSVPTLPEVIMDSWFVQQQLPRIKKRGNPNSHVDIDFIEAIQKANGNFFDTGVFGIAITDVSDDAADFADADAFDLSITSVNLEDFQLSDEEVTSFTIKYPDQGVEIFNSGVPGFVSANVIINGVNQSARMQGVVSVTREDNTAARFKCILEIDQTTIPVMKPSELINKEVLISFAAADMDGVVADYFPIFVGICKQVKFNDDQESIIMTGYDRGGVHQTKGEFVSDNVTDVLTGSLYVNSAGTHSLGHSPIWGVVWTGNAIVTDGEDYFVNTLNGEIIVPISSRILQFPGAFTYSYQNPFGSMREIIQTVATIKGWTVEEDNVTIEDYSSTAEHPVLSLSDESVIDVCRKLLELSGAKVETNLFPSLRVYSEVQNVINNVNIHVFDESIIFEDSLIYGADFDDILNEQTTRSVQKINANVVVGSSGTIAEFSGSQGTTDPRRVQTDVVWWANFDLTTPTVLAEHRINKAGLNSISFSSSGTFSAALIPFETFEETITGASWNSFTDGDDFVIQLKHTIVTLGGGGVQMWAFPAFDYTLTVSGSKINYGDGTIEDVQIVTAQRPIAGITETLKGDVYENAYIETDQHCANICDAILLEHGNPYTAQFDIPVFEGKSLNIGDRVTIQKNSNDRFYGLIKTLSYSINLATGQNAIRVGAKGVGIGI
jgi:hypothetical protein